ncbi:hypothetical protein IW261DRAFT_1508491 [Armillaria novae-zelandiae]|uniref:Uncharacterized protein n=1 Tax=Armillaria novae-zelandiae TaxID=153914 RepID=A0AA39NV13_9AGAR|nr:hypothetical protein IW261DRAFT_1508491 [Armillaria novae-zelandiae]
MLSPRSSHLSGFAPLIFLYCLPVGKVTCVMHRPHVLQPKCSISVLSGLGLSLYDVLLNLDFRGNGNTQNSERGRERCLQSQ